MSGTTRPSHQVQSDSAVLEKVKVTRPPRYSVWMLNDDFTPMEFVVEVLQAVFHLAPAVSQRLMWEIHTKGKSRCGVYSYDIATTKAKKAMELATESGHPLRCIVEKENRET